MKTLEQIKNDYAVSKGYDNFCDIIYNENVEEISEYIDEVMKIYAIECLKLASEFNDTYSCRNDIDEPFKVYVSKASITNENNIIK